MSIIYEDERVICNELGITIKDFYQPLEGDKEILYNEIREVKIKKISPFAGLSQIWGDVSGSLSGDNGGKNYWSAFDLKRIFKSKAIVIDDRKSVKSVITPEDVDTVFQILRERILAVQ